MHRRILDSICPTSTCTWYMVRLPWTRQWLNNTYNGKKKQTKKTPPRTIILQSRTMLHTSGRRQLSHFYFKRRQQVVEFNEGTLYYSLSSALLWRLIQAIIPLFTSYGLRLLGTYFKPLLSVISSFRAQLLLTVSPGLWPRRHHTDKIFKPCNLFDSFDRRDYPKP